MTNGARKKDSAKLAWDTKPKRAPNPKDIDFQTAELVIPNPQLGGQLQLDMLSGDKNFDKRKMNRLIWGDNLLAMQALLAQGYEGKINLIYIDPPFDSKADYSHKMTIEKQTMKKEPSIIERLAYKDTWAGGTDSYLDMMYSRLYLMKRLLADDGSIFVHLDWHVGHYVKVLMDEIFGKENFLNEIIWHYRTYQGQVKGYFPRKHDAIFWYFKKNRPHFNLDYSSDFQHTVDYSRWERFIVNHNEIRGDNYPKTDTRFMAYYNRWVEEHGRKPTADDVIYRVKGYVVDDVWEDIQAIDPKDLKEKLGYTTQKPYTLLERIIKSCSRENELVADFFVGSGTTIAVADKLKRQWIGAELGKVGVQVTRGRLVQSLANPFLIENIGNYQRQMIYLSGGKINEMQAIILKLYGAQPLAGRQDLGARQNEDGNMELVYCGYPDRPVTARKAAELAREARFVEGASHNRLVILAWDYEYNYDSLLKQELATTAEEIAEIVSRQIPHNIYDYLRSAKNDDDIEKFADKVKFHDKPYLQLASPKIKGQEAEIRIANYALFDMPLGFGKKAEEDREKLLHLKKDNFAVLIDYWAVDWNYDGRLFKSVWQAMRGNGKKAVTVPTFAFNKYKASGEYNVAVRVVDIFGNDATATQGVKIP